MQNTIGELGEFALITRVTDQFPLTDDVILGPGDDAAITAAPDGACWFSQWQGNRIGHIAASGAITEYALPSPASEPHGLTLGPDGAVWVALEARGVARLEI